MVNRYLKASEPNVGLVLNFGSKSGEHTGESGLAALTRPEEDRDRGQA